MGGIMRKTVGTLVLVLATTLGAAACGVDKKGTADNLIKGIEKAAGNKLTDGQRTCLTDLVKGYSDEDLKKLDKSDADLADPLVEQFSEKMVGCMAGE